jgi:lipoprotein signal peptidase
MRKSPFFRTALACGCILIVDFVLKQLAPSVMPEPSDASSAFFAYQTLSTKALSLAEVAALPNAGLALFSMVIASVFVAAALASHIFLPARLRAWPIGLGIAAGGFFANAVDRALHGDVLNVFNINLGGNALNFNFADVAEVVGGVFLVYGLMRAFKGDWRNERRKFLILDRGYQFRFCWYLQAAMSIGFFPMFFSALLIFHGSPSSPALVLLFIATAFFAYLALSVVSWSIGILISHRVAGPIFKFSKVAVRRLNGSRPGKTDKAFTFRENDEFQKPLRTLMHEVDRFTGVVDTLKKKTLAATTSKIAR